MLDLNIIWDRMSLLPEQLLPFHKRQCNSATAQKIRRPGSSPMSWMALESPEMPDKFREHTAEKVERERPIYTISPNGDITVSQSWILGFHPATEEEMLACDDRREQNAMGDILYEGPLHPAKPSPTRRHRAANSGATALPPPAFLIDLTVTQKVKTTPTYVDLTIDNAAWVPPAAQAMTSRAENALLSTNTLCVVSSQLSPFGSWRPGSPPTTSPIA